MKEREEAFDTKCINIYLNDIKLVKERISIKKLKILKKVNEHNNMYLEFIFRKEDTDIYKSLNKSENLDIKITISDKDTMEKIIFDGYALNSIMTLDKHQLLIKISGISYSKKLDINKYNRVYQDKNIKYSKIMNDIEKKNSGYNILMNKEDSETGKFLIQYGETDWNFMKRLASYEETYIVCEKKSVILNKKSVKEHKEISNYTIYSFGRNRKKEIEYKIDSYNIYSTGDIVKLNDGDSEGKMLVTEIQLILENQRLKGRYTLIREDKYKSDIIEVKSLRGTAFEGQVQEILMSNDKGSETASIKVKFYENLDSKFTSNNTLDENQGPELFSLPYIIPYSKDKTGLFISPEKGDNVVIRFGDENPENGFVTGALNNENSSRFSNPNYRNFFVKDSMELIIDGSNIELNSASEIRKTAKTIEFKGTESVMIYSNNMKVK